MSNFLSQFLVTETTKIVLDSTLQIANQGDYELSIEYESYLLFVTSVKRRR
jgi:hypothetical protein